MAKHSASETEAAGPSTRCRRSARWKQRWPARSPTRYLLDALTHRSYAYEFAGPGIVSNERLEFLGDAVIALIASDLLFARYPAADEGTLTQYRAALVRASTLARFADDLHLGAYFGWDAEKMPLAAGLANCCWLRRSRQWSARCTWTGSFPTARRVLDPLLAGAIERISQNGGQRQIKDDKSLLQGWRRASLA